MRRLRWALPLALLSLLAAVQPTIADDRRLLVDYIYARQGELLETGVWAWRYHQTAYGADIEAAARQGIAEWGEAANVVMVEDLNDGAHLHATGGPEFIFGDGTHPGCGLGATACVWGYGGDFATAFDSVAMFTWSLRSQTGVVLHELGHVLFGLGEQYQGHDSGTILCTRKPWSVMDCGLGHALTIQPFDLESAAVFYLPGPVAGASLDLSGAWGPAVVWYGPSVKNDERGVRIGGWPNCTRVAVYRWRLSWESVEWAGTWGGCSRSSLSAVAVAREQGTCYLVGAENGLPPTWGKGLQWAGCVP